MEKFIKLVEEKIGYNFSNKCLLEQAFIRKSYSSENGGENNEVLEFIGDKALDNAVIKLMMDRYGKLLSYGDKTYFHTEFDEGVFTNIKMNLVDKTYLANAIEKLGFKDYLILNEGDISQNIQDEPSVKEDLFEAILGAVTLDSGWDFKVIVRVVERMLDITADFDFEELIEDKNSNFVALVQEYSQGYFNKVPDYEYESNEDKNSFIAKLYIDGKYISSGEGLSKPKARKEAALKGYGLIKDRDKGINKYEKEVGKPSLENAIQQVNELEQKKLINKPTYEYTDNLDALGEDKRWGCFCIIYEASQSFYAYGKTKQDAKRIASYLALEDLMN